MTFSRSEHGAASTRDWRGTTWATLLGLLSIAVLAVHGYHPWAEDGGLYVAGIERSLDPGLFPFATEFATEHTRFSIFAPFVAGTVRLTHLRLDWTLLLLYMVSIGLTLTAGRGLLRRCGFSNAAQLAGTALLAVWWTLPVAATSLLLMDPYLTARSFTLPLSLFAVAYASDDWRNRRAWLSCVLCVVAAFAFHPLMAAYSAAFVSGVRVARLRRATLGWVVMGLLAFALAGAVHAMGVPSHGAQLAAERSRYYWFLSEWHGYEIFGLAGPLIVMAFLPKLRRHQARMHLVVEAGIALGCIAALVCAIFCRESDPVHLVARLQPLRIFLLLYAVMALLLGATLTEWLQERRPQLAALAVGSALLLSGAGMCAVQRDTFPASIHIELPGRTNPNPWVHAFRWARDNTSRDALFALDARYINERGEDAQTFRAISLRSALPDFSKDGGEAAITPALAAEWQAASQAQNNLSTSGDAERDLRILPLGATWMILHAQARTSHVCPYSNDTVKVCRLY